MFKNAAKRVFAAVLVCVLFVPCFFASAQRTPQDFMFIRSEVARCQHDHNLQFITDEGVVVEPNQMNAKQLKNFYAQLLKRGLARDIISYNDGSLGIPEYVWQEIRSEMLSAGVAPDNMTYVQLLQTYNNLADNGKVSGLGKLMKVPFPY